MKLFLNENTKIENYSILSTKQSIDEIDDITNSISDNISKEIKIPSDVLNSFAIKSELNTKIWENDKLNQSVRTKLVKIANDFFKELNLPSEVKMKDIIFTGSLANFNWSKYSDIDLHIVLDFSQIEAEDQFKEDFFYAQKALWNQAHDITVYEYPVELYAQDIKAKLVASAVYSLKNDKWILKPSKEEFKVNKKVIKQKADRFIDKLKAIRKDYQDNELQSVIDKVKNLKDKIKNYRTSGLEDGGEYAIENLVFKTLRRTPFMDILDSYKAKAYDKLMSVKETSPINEEVIEEGELVDNTKFKLVKNGDEISYVATYEGEVIGNVYMDVIYNLESYFEGDFSEEELENLFNDDNVLVIEWLEVPDDYYKGGGVGRALMNKAIGFAKKKGFNQIYLNASPIGDKGLNVKDLTAWYKTFGFTPILDQGNNVQMLLNLNINENKTIIKNMLSLLTEANNRYATKRDYYTTLFKVTKAKQLYGNDPYWENVQDGQWVGAVIVNIFGRISKVSTYNAPAGQVRTNDLGMRGENPHYMEFKIMAGRGIEHPNSKSPNLNSARTRKGLDSEEFENDTQFTMKLPDGVSLENGETSISFGMPKPGSPASDAHIKTYLIYGDLILDFVENNLKDKIGYVDGTQADVAKEKTADKNQYKYDKYEKEKQRAANKAQRPISIDTDKQTEFEKRQADAIARRDAMMARRNKNK
jgi:predicted GNAT family acetyltransferase